VPSYYINGEDPQLVGAQCTGFALHHFYEGHQITDQVNVAHFRLGDQWYRLHFECSTIFWKTSGNPEPPQNHDPACGLLLNDLSGIDGVVGHTIREFNYYGSESGDVGFTVRFSSGKQLTFRYSCEADATQLVAVVIALNPCKR
jgi:hypothetical protein